MGSGGEALATKCTGEVTPGEAEEVPPAMGVGCEIAMGNAQRAGGGGSWAGGTTEVFAGGVGVIGQLATLAGSPWQLTKTATRKANVAVDIGPVRPLPIFKTQELTVPNLRVMDTADSDLFVPDKTADMAAVAGSRRVARYTFYRGRRLWRQ